MILKNHNADPTTPAAASTINAVANAAKDAAAVAGDGSVCEDFVECVVTTFPSKRHCRAISHCFKVDEREDPLSCQEKQTFVIRTD